MSRGKTAKRLILLVALLGLTACGDVDWLPETTPEASRLTSRSESVGTFIATYRDPGHMVATTRGVFSTYTSLHAPAASAVYMDTYSDAQTSAVTGTFLRAGAATALVLRVVEMEELP